LGLPTGLPLNGFHLYISFTIPVSGSLFVSKPTQSLSFKITYYVFTYPVLLKGILH
jgi:hypothetical protein